MPNLQAIKAELLAGHPVTGPYDADNAVAADQLNAVNRTRNKTSMSGRQIAAEIVSAEYNVLSAEKKTQALSLIASDDIDPFGFAANVIKDIFGGASATITALQAARVEDVSRAEELGLGNIREGTVAQARAL